MSDTLTDDEINSAIYDALEAKGEVPEDEVVETAEHEDSTELETAENAEEIELISAPGEWNPDLKAGFELLANNEARQAMVDAHKNMYKNYQADKQALAPIKQTAEMVQKHLDPYMSTIQMQGQTPDQYMQTVLATADNLYKNPQETIKYLAAQYGVSFGEQSKESEEWVDPQVKALQEKIEQMEQANKQSQFQQQQQTYQQQQSQAQAVQQQQQAAIESFKTATDGEGALKHPHFQDEDVQQAMIFFGQQAQAKGEQPDPQALYSQAVRMLGKDVAAPKQVAPRGRVKATVPDGVSPQLTTAQMAAMEYDKMVG